MKRRIIIRIIFLIFMLSSFIIIFRFSSQNANESKTLSIKVMRVIIDINPKTKNLSENEKDKMVKNSQQVIRKVAHFTIYMTLGIMTTGFFSTYDISWKKKSLIVILIGLIYAISDEVHQGIAGGGRTPNAFDVCIDTFGMLIGTIITCGIVKILTKNKKNIKNY